jgi:hypothetical protein
MFKSFELFIMSAFRMAVFMRRKKTQLDVATSGGDASRKSRWWCVVIVHIQSQLTGNQPVKGGGGGLKLRTGGVPTNTGSGVVVIGPCTIGALAMSSGTVTLRL